MIQISETEVFGWEAAIRGMRNPMNSWDKSDTPFSCIDCEGCYYELEKNVETTETEDAYRTDTWCNHNCLKLGEADLKLMKSLSKAGDDHGKFLRFINVTMDITAPLYWWKEFDTYKVGTVSNSCSTMHKIHTKEFTLDDFSCEQLLNTGCDLFDVELERGLFRRTFQPMGFLCEYIIPVLNTCREKYLETKNKDYWWQMIQLLPSSYNQKRTVQLNYQVLKTMYHARKNHKLDEWREFCKWCESLPYFKEICLG